MKILMLLLCASLAHSAETKVKLADLPPAVQKTIKEKTQGAKLKHIVKDTSKDAPTYEAEMFVAGKEKTVTVDATGGVVEIEETVALASLPARAQGAIMKAAEGGKVLKVESVSHGGAVEIYEALIKKAGKKKEFAVDPDGKPVAD
jgi:uncharacterized membrane protein YkoI